MARCLDHQISPIFRSKSRFPPFNPILGVVDSQIFILMLVIHLSTCPLSRCAFLLRQYNIEYVLCNHPSACLVFGFGSCGDVVFWKVTSSLRSYLTVRKVCDSYPLSQMLYSLDSQTSVCSCCPAVGNVSSLEEHLSIQN